MADPCQTRNEASCADKQRTPRLYDDDDDEQSTSPPRMTMARPIVDVLLEAWSPRYRTCKGRKA